MLLSLSALQIEAAKRFGLSVQQVLDTCQRLYETHKLITYPRSDCRYLPEEHFAGRQAVLAAIAGHQPELMTQGQLNTDQRNRCWNDKKVMLLYPPPEPAAGRSTTASRKSTAWWRVSI